MAAAGGGISSASAAAASKLNGAASAMCVSVDCTGAPSSRSLGGCRCRSRTAEKKLRACPPADSACRWSGPSGDTCICVSSVGAPMCCWCGWGRLCGEECAAACESISIESLDIGQRGSREGPTEERRACTHERTTRRRPAHEPRVSLVLSFALCWRGVVLFRGLRWQRRTRSSVDGARARTRTIVSVVLPRCVSTLAGACVPIPYRRWCVWRRRWRFKPRSLKLADELTRTDRRTTNDEREGGRARRGEDDRREGGGRMLPFPTGLHCLFVCVRWVVRPVGV